MNRVQWFLTKISQESSELIKDATKTAMFGLESYDPQDEQKRQNLQLVVEEFFDVVAAFEQFIDEVGVREYIPLLNDPEVQAAYIAQKKERNETYLQIGLNLGTAFLVPTEASTFSSQSGNLKTCSNCLEHNSKDRNWCSECGCEKFF